VRIIKFLYNNLITWVVFLALIQVFVAFYIQPIAEQLDNEQAIYEKIKSEVPDNSQLAELFKAQQVKLERKNKIIAASISFQKTIGGLTAIVLAFYLSVLFRRSVK